MQLSKIKILALLLISICIIGCGKKSTNTYISNSSQSSSSSEQQIKAQLEFVYPTQKAHIGGATSTQLIVKVLSTGVEGTVAKITIGGVALVKNGLFWVSSNPLNLSSSDDQEFSSSVELADGTYLEANTLVLNNMNGITPSKAGGKSVYSVTGISFNQNTEEMYYSNPIDAQVLAYDKITGDSDIIYEGQYSPELTNQVFWPIAVDSESGSIFLSEDISVFDETKVTLVKIAEGENPVKFEDVDKTILSTRGLILDLNSKAPMSGINAVVRYPSIYSLDAVSQSPLQRWISVDSEWEVAPQVLTASNSDSVVSAEYGLAAIDAFFGSNDAVKFLIIRQNSSVNGTGESSLVQLTSSASNVTVSTRTTKLTSMSGVTKPTALLYSRDGTNVYIADFDRIWKMDLTTFNKTLISSSSLLSGKIGTGPSLGSNITAMALHPTLNYLYLAADTNGVIMVDLDTGNRITIIK